ncbi:MAG TPA: pyrrolo-quinoline quinone [Verrucomicrobiales bacterium]|nr:pyrrolo-quinoline quinone [Verrucomicrobiales bacterium]
MNKPLSARNRTSVIAAAALIGVSAVATNAEDWPQWGRNESKNMYSPAKGMPDRFEAGKYKRGTEEIDMSTTKNVKWVAKLGSQTYGNPVVSQGKILVGTNNESPRDPQHQGDRSVLYCFDEKTGDFLWQLVVPKLTSGKVNDWENLGILSSPRVEGNRVYLVTSRCEVICVDLNGLTDGNQGMQDEAQYVAGPGNTPAKITPKDADILWVYDMMNELGVFPHNASNSSPVIIGDLVYVSTSNGQDWTHVNIPAPLSPSFIALNKHTGELAGEDDAGISKNIFHGQWSSPSAGMVNGKPMVFYGGGDGWLYAFSAKPEHDADEGIDFLKTTWKVDSNPPEYKEKDGKPIKYPDAEGPNEINSTPVLYKNRVYVAHGQDPEHGEGIGRLICVDATKEGDISDSGIIWEYRGIHRSISTVSIDPETDLLFVGDFSGFVHCLDANTGKLHWTHDMKAHMWGSTLVADGKVYIGDEDGDFVVLAATKEKKLISETNMGSPIYSTPIIANGVMYVGTQTHLYAIHDSARASLTADQPPTVELKK